MINIFNFLRVFTASQSLPIVTMLALFLLIIFITAYFYYVYKKEQDFEETQEKLEDDYDSILLKAHRKAEDIVKDATEKAKSLLVSSKDVKEYSKKELDSAIQKETEQILESFSASIAGIRNDALTYVKQMADQTQSLTKEELASFRDSMVKDLVQVHLQETQKLSAEAEKAYQEIKTYKEHEMEKVKQQIGQIIVRVSEDVIGKSISLQDQEKMVLDSLEQAKQEGFFSA